MTEQDQLEQYNEERMADAYFQEQQDEHEAAQALSPDSPENSAEVGIDVQRLVLHSGNYYEKYDHPDHADDTDCLDRAVGCSKHCFCCMGELAIPLQNDKSTNAEGNGK